jgi:hypothetical protein
MNQALYAHMNNKRKMKKKKKEKKSLVLDMLSLETTTSFLVLGKMRTGTLVKF